VRRSAYPYGKLSGVSEVLPPGNRVHFVGNFLVYALLTAPRRQTKNEKSAKRPKNIQYEFFLPLERLLLPNYDKNMIGKKFLCHLIAFSQHFYYSIIY